MNTTEITILMEKKLERSNWIKWKFSDLVENIVEKVSPQKSDLERYIGLTHLDTASLKIRRFGEAKSIEGDKLKIYKGDLIFAKRNSYLKRVAIAEFDAIASAHSLVLRAKSENINPDFLSFFMMSETFWKRAIEISVGSLSPTINWKALAKQEFLLPPIEQQNQLAELFLHINNVVETNITLKEKALTNYEVMKNNLVLKGKCQDCTYSETLKEEVSSSWTLKNLEDLLDEGAIVAIQDGNHGDIHPKSSDYIESGIPFIMANTLINGRIDFVKTKKLPLMITEKLRIGFAKPKDVLLSHKGTIGEVALVPEKIDYPYLMLTPQVTYYRVNNQHILSEFLYFAFLSGYFQKQLIRLSSQSTRAYIGITAQKKLKIMMPNSIDEQKEIVQILEVLETNIRIHDDRIKSSKGLQKSLINQVF